MTTTTGSKRPSRVMQGIALFCAMLVVYHVWQLPTAWAAWNGGQPDSYPGQHRGLLLGHVTGLALALAIPIPAMMGIASGWSRGRRVVLWVMWGVLMAITISSLVLQFAK